MQNKTLIASLSAILLSCIWSILAAGLLSIRRDDIRALFMSPDSYNTTKGQIISSKVAYNGMRSGGWQFEIFYEYVSNKVHYVATGNGTTNAYALGYVKKYPVGRNVTVYYEKVNPSKAVLEPENRSSFIFYFVIFLFVVAGFHFLLAVKFYIRHRRSRSKPIREGWSDY